tara:strand:- start:202 stop:396 length:195 start_codon:yes stop_codon:yes gene_type:complete
MSKAEKFLEFAMSYKDRELVDFMRELFDKFKNNEIDEEILESLVQETMEEFGRRNYMHAKRSLH